MGVSLDLSVGDPMTSVLSIAILALAFQQQVPQAHRNGLPIRFAGATGSFDIPLDVGLLGWQPQPLRRITTEPIEHPSEDGETAPEPANGLVHLAIRDRALKRENFDHWLYGELNEQSRSVWLLSTLSAKVSAARTLSADEEAKLILAGRGDIKRFLDRIEAKRAEFELVRTDFMEGQVFLTGPEMRRLSFEFKVGPFGEGSLFAKSLRKIEYDRAMKARPATGRPRSGSR
jgi:hypothetical protein